MNNQQNILIGILTCTAVILGTLIFFTMQDDAQAGGAASSGTETLKVQQPGTFILGSAQVDDKKSVVYLIDSNAMRLTVFYPNLNNGSIERLDGRDLSKMRSLSGR